MKIVRIILYLGIIVFLSACKVETPLGEGKIEKSKIGNAIIITGEQDLSNNIEKQMTTTTGSNFNPFNKKNLPPLTKDIVSDIKGRLSRFEKKIDIYTLKQKELIGSTEGGEGIYYYENDKIKKISAKYYGETGNILYEFYYSSIGNLYFVLESKEEYSHPLYLEQELGEATITKSEYEYYFFKDKIVMYLDENKEEINQEMDIFQQKEEELLNISEELMKL